MDNSISKSDIRSRMIISLISLLVTAIILGIVFAHLKLVPFSSDPSATSLAYDDAYFQFIDFLAFFKDVLSGKQSLGYSFSNYLGQSDYALFTYYLSSPFNLLLFFFDKDKVMVFFDLIIFMKICLCALTFSLFLSGRYKKELPSAFNILLSAGYALMQYNMHQCFNYEYLDGMYMFPLMMLGVYRAVKDKKATFLSIATGCSLLFNWYTGCLNCLFSFFFFLAEGALHISDMPKEERVGEIKGGILTYIRAMVPGVMVSFVFLIPTLFEIRQGKADGIDWYLLKNIITEDPVTLIRNYYIGSGRTWSGMANSVFCGTFALLGAIGIFSVSDKAVSLRKKLVYACMLLFMFAMIYLSPMYLLFSLLKKPAGHTGRYLYLGSFILLYIAGAFFCRLKEVRWKRYAISMVLYLILFVLSQFKYPVKDIKLIVFTCIHLIVIWALAALYGSGRKSSVFLSLILMLSFTELGINSDRILDIYSNYRGYTEHDFETYEDEEQGLITRIFKHDSDAYRITQTRNRDITFDAPTANYNESLAFSYASIGSYTSTPHSLQLDFLCRGGYRNEGATPSVVMDVPIIPMDSILGVKYTLSSYDINGYEKEDVIPGAQDKEVYKNPFAIPIACKANKYDYPIYAANPFEYHQGLVTALTGEMASFYEPVSFTYKDEGRTRVYELETFGENYAYYAYIPWKDDMREDGIIDINGKMKKPYSVWNSEDLFYIPVDAKDDKAYIALTGFDQDLIKNEIFFALDLDAFEKATQILRDNAADKIEIKNGRVECSIKAHDGEWMFMSVPADAGWTIKRNGKKTESEQFENCLMMIPLEEGSNDIIMEYHIPYLIPGALLSVIGIILMVIVFHLSRIKPNIFMI